MYKINNILSFWFESILYYSHKHSFRRLICPRLIPTARQILILLNKYLMEYYPFDVYLD